MSAGRALMLAAVLVTAACTPSVEYPPPPQKDIPGGAEATLEARIFRMNDPHLEQRIVAEVTGGDAAAQWRWTNQRPRLKMSIEPETWIFHAGFTVPEVVLNRVGPLTLTFVVNDRVIGKQRYAQDGHHEFETPVSRDVLGLTDPVVFGFDVDPVFIAEGDGAKLGVLLEAIGFRKAPR
jgi:hypothetical protein